MEQINFKQSLALLWITILNQSQNSKNVIKNVGTLFERLDMKDEFKICSYEEIYHAMTVPTVLHRFPKKMSIYLSASLHTIVNNFEKDPVKIFSNKRNIRENLLIFDGIGQHKADIAIYIYTIAFCTIE